MILVVKKIVDQIKIVVVMVHVLLIMIQVNVSVVLIDLENIVSRAATDSDCTTDNSHANQEKCICECKPGYIGSVNAGVCVKDEKIRTYLKIIDWYNSNTNETKIVVLSGVTITTISIIILIVMISKSKTSAKLILK